MVSTPLILVLSVMCVAIAVASAVERNWPRALYFVGATAINVAILMWGKG